MASTVSTRIAEARRAAKLSQEDLARVTGLRLRAIQSWEQGLRHPRLAALETLADVLGHDVAWFYADHDAKAAA
jgi:transcriptional regulator with XRE-family HTH domain